MAHDDQRFPGFAASRGFDLLAQEVVSVLRSRQTGDASDHYRPYVNRILDRRLTSKAYFNPSDALDELRALRLSDEAIVDEYIPDAARLIGEKWVRNEIGFADVTIASVRLQSLLNEVEFHESEAAGFTYCPFDVLIASSEAEQHTLGLFVLAAQLRRRGFCVQIMCGDPMDTLASTIVNNDFDAVLFSSSRLRDLDGLEKCVKHAKSKLTRLPLFALGGLVTEKIKGVDGPVGIDLVTSDIDTVVEHCARRSKRGLAQAIK